jgi:hypothetical protein
MRLLARSARARRVLRAEPWRAAVLSSRSGLLPSEVWRQARHSLSRRSCRSARSAGPAITLVVDVGEDALRQGMQAPGGLDARRGVRDRARVKTARRHRATKLGSGPRASASVTSRDSQPVSSTWRWSGTPLSAACVSAKVTRCTAGTTALTATCSRPSDGPVLASTREPHGDVRPPRRADAGRRPRPPRVWAAEWRGQPTALVGRRTRGSFDLGTGYGGEVDDDAIRSLVKRLRWAHPSGGTVIERAAVLAEFEAVMAWIVAHRGEPEAAVSRAAKPGLHGLRVGDRGRRNLAQRPGSCSRPARSANCAGTSLAAWRPTVLVAAPRFRFAATSERLRSGARDACLGRTASAIS